MKILCTLPNASDEISGVAFEKCDKGMVSVDQVPEDVAAAMLSVDGYAEYADTAPAEAPDATVAKGKKKAVVQPAAPVDTGASQPADPSGTGADQPATTPSENQ